MPTRSLTGRTWLLPEEGEVHSPQETLAMLMQERGVGAEFLAETTAAFQAFVRSPAMQQAVERIQRALHSGERVAIVGDYDCDGITASAQLVRFFRRHQVEPVLRLPHRMNDGYGLKHYMIDELVAQNVTLMITVDTGIGAAKEIAYAKSHHIDVIVTDHHHVPSVLPEAILVHPVLCNVPEPHPAGAGVAFCLVHALEAGVWDERGTDVSLAMIGTVADIVPLRGINRLLVTRGLHELHALQGSPLAELRAQVAKNNEPLKSGDIGYRLAPRINAAGRLGDPTIALHALLEGGEGLQTLEQLNATRQQETEQGVAEAGNAIGIDMQSALPVPPTLQPFLFLARKEFAPGIIGLIAGKLTERTGRPSLVGNIANNMVTASLRSVRGYNITEGLTRVSHLLESFGGHAAAAGCTFRTENASALEAALLEDVDAHLPLEERGPTQRIDAIIEQRHVSLAFAEQLSLLEPFGAGNPEPRFLLLNTTLQNIRCVGQEGMHVQATLGGVKCIGFRLGALAPQFMEQPVDVVCKMDIDTWGKAPQVQLVIEDVRVSVAAGAMAKRASF